MARTFGEMKTEVTNWLREPYDATLISDAVNDAIGDLWQNLLQANLNEFVGGPVSNITFASGDERQRIISITDPTATDTAAWNATSGSAGGSQPARNVKVAFTYCTESGSETLACPPKSFAVSSGVLILASCPPFWDKSPDGGTTPSPAQQGAIGWCMYVAVENPYTSGVYTPFVKQTGLGGNYIFPFTGVGGGASYVEPLTGCNDFSNTGNPVLSPSENDTGDDIAYIKYFQVQLPNGTWKRWVPADLESVLMKQAESSIAASSPYQNYVWDMVNNRQIEVRPTIAGGPVTPRYFAVKRPRRYAYDGAKLPFASFDATPYLRYRSMELLKLSQEEVILSSAWRGQANAEVNDVKIMANSQNKNKATTITPFRR